MEVAEVGARGVEEEETEVEVAGRLGVDDAGALGVAGIGEDTREEEEGGREGEGEEKGTEMDMVVEEGGGQGREMQGMQVEAAAGGEVGVDAAPETAGLSFAAVLLALAKAASRARAWWLGGDGGGETRGGRGASKAAPPPPYLVLSTGDHVQVRHRQAPPPSPPPPPPPPPPSPLPS